MRKNAQESEEEEGDEEREEDEKGKENEQRCQATTIKTETNISLIWKN